MKNIIIIGATIILLLGCASTKETQKSETKKPSELTTSAPKNVISEIEITGKWSEQKENQGGIILNTDGTLSAERINITRTFETKQPISGFGNTFDIQESILASPVSKPSNNTRIMIFGFIGTTMKFQAQKVDVEFVFNEEQEEALFTIKKIPQDIEVIKILIFNRGLMPLIFRTKTPFKEQPQEKPIEPEKPVQIQQPVLEQPKPTPQQEQKPKEGEGILIW